MKTLPKSDLQPFTLPQKIRYKELLLSYKWKTQIEIAGEKALAK